MEISEAFSKLRIYALGGPLYAYCKALQSGKALTGNFDFKFRRDTHCWITPKGDRISIVFGFEFPIKSDKIIGNQILTVCALYVCDFAIAQIVVNDCRNFSKCDDKKICKAVQ